MFTSWSFSALVKRPSFFTTHINHCVKRLLGQKMGERVQLTNRVMLIRPSCFNYNPQTAISNEFQLRVEGMSDSEVQEQALKEFETLAEKLREVKVSVKIFDDTVKLSPDAVFPNNWISFHSDGGTSKMVAYPMMSENRRLERNPEITGYWAKTLNSTLVDYTHYEGQGKFLEGTGSMVLDRVNRIVYACTSPRTCVQVLENYCKDFGYTPIVFRSVISPRNDGRLQEVYHTNVMMSISEGFSVICLDSIPDKRERDMVVKSLEETNKEIVDITVDQVNQFGGNILQLAGLDGRKHLLLSTRAHSSFTPEQLAVFQRHCDSLVPVPLDVIEKAGGGGVRCMIAEVFPPLP